MDSNMYRNVWVESSIDLVFWSHSDIPKQYWFYSRWAQAHLLQELHFRLDSVVNLSTTSAVSAVSLSLSFFFRATCSNWQYTAAVKLFYLRVFDLLSRSSTWVGFVNFHRLPSELCVCHIYSEMFSQHLLHLQTGSRWLAPWKKLPSVLFLSDLRLGWLKVCN